mmetsp:Transcript_82721/g.233799  ORF Transcript_82721/g.233799 Transcript_82721/m.233799 type:complete len:247 (+) Transcript_82721:209-949(+)
MSRHNLPTRFGHRVIWNEDPDPVKPIFFVNSPPDNDDGSQRTVVRGHGTSSPGSDMQANPQRQPDRFGNNALWNGMPDDPSSLRAGWPRGRAGTGASSPGSNSSPRPGSPGSAGPREIFRGGSSGSYFEDAGDDANGGDQHVHTDMHASHDTPDRFGNRALWNGGPDASPEGVALPRSRAGWVRGLAGSTVDGKPGSAVRRDPYDQRSPPSLLSQDRGVHHNSSSLSEPASAASTAGTSAGKFATG